MAPLAVYEAVCVACVVCTATVVIRRVQRTEGPPCLTILLKEHNILNFHDLKSWCSAKVTCSYCKKHNKAKLSLSPIRTKILKWPWVLKAISQNNHVTNLPTVITHSWCSGSPQFFHPHFPSTLTVNQDTEPANCLIPVLSIQPCSLKLPWIIRHVLSPIWLTISLCNSSRFKERLD